MKLVKSDRRTLMTEKTLSKALMIKLEGPTIKDFNPDAAIDLCFNKHQRRSGTSGSKENKVDMDEAIASFDVSTETDKEEEAEEEKYVEHIQDEIQDAVNQGQVYELVQQPDDSDYESDYIS